MVGIPVSDPPLEASAASILATIKAIPAVDTASIVQALDAINTSLQQISGARSATLVVVGLPTITSRTGTIIMADSITFSDDEVAHIKLNWADAIGSVSPPADASATSSDTAVGLAAIENGGAGVAITPVKGAVGAFNVDISGNAGMATDIIAVTVTAPVATKVTADTANATFTPNV